MTLRLHNTLSRTKEEFVPLDPKNVRMYVCGPTVYDFAHIGNARPVIVFDVLFRLLRHIYGEKHVTYVRNITDIDDKINARALELRGSRNVDVLEAVREITEKTAKQYHEDVAALGCLPPTHEPRATENIPPMIAMIGDLIAAGYAYEAQGHVLFDVVKKKDYGKLAHRSLDEMIAGARVEVAPYKRNPMDFVLWKPSDANTPGWDSPWGRGRPGWHLECSAMSEALLGETFDIHGGGIDLMFPHHENEIAQSEGAHHGHPLARYWLHNGFLNVEGEKMSKSLGNFVTIRELLRRAYGPVIRYNMLKTHYRQPTDWTELALVESRYELLEWSELFASFSAGFDVNDVDSEVIDALADDLNTPAAITRLRELFHLAKTKPLEFIPKLRASAEFLGVTNIEKSAYLRAGIAYYVPEEMQQTFEEAHVLALHARMAVANNLPEADSLLQKIKDLGFKYTFTHDGDIHLSYGSKSFDDEVNEKIAARVVARANKDFKEADRIRDELLAQGIVLKDNADGTTTWEVKR